MSLQVTNISLNNRVQALEDKTDTVIARLEAGNAVAVVSSTRLASQGDDIA